MFVFNKCEHPGCLEAGNYYAYPQKEEKEKAGMVLCEEHAAENGFCFCCRKWKGLTAWFHSSGLCEDCFDEHGESFERDGM